MKVIRCLPVGCTNKGKLGYWRTYFLSVQALLFGVDDLGHFTAAGGSQPPK